MSPVHDGHRARMRRRLSEEGLAGFAPHEVLEFLLFYAIPQRNVNPLAHHLMERFGTLDDVLRASKAQLMEVPGVGCAVADWLLDLRRALDAYASSRLADRPRLDRLSAVVAYGKGLFDPACPELLWALCLNASGYLLHSATLAKSHSEIETLDPARVIDAALRYHARAVVLLQRSVSQSAAPRERDIRFTARVSELLGSVRVLLMDDVTIRGNEWSSLHELGILRISSANNRLNGSSILEKIARRWLE